MVATFHRLQPFTMAVIFSMDVDPGFYVKPCNDASLFDTVHGGMFMAEKNEQSRTETTQIVAGLKESGSVDFEDGWIKLCVGLTDVIAFLVEKVGEAKHEERYADEQRFKEHKAREEWQTRYEALRAALVDALVPNAPDILSKVA